MMNLLPSFKKIKAFVLDVDGVLTDSTILVLNDGQHARVMNIRDGYALQLAIKKGYKILIISGGNSDAVKVRMQKLGVLDVFMQIDNKKEILLQYVHQHGLTWEEILYMGDDIPDLEVMKLAGMACCPSDAVAEIRQVSHYVSPVAGGAGCVRDVIEKVLKMNDHWHHDTVVSSK